MHSRHLKYFVTVARCGSFSRASAELHIAQPALSSQIAALEEELSIPLFTRHSRGIALTEAGRALLQRAEHILALIESARVDLLAFRPVIEGEVRLGLPTTSTAVLAQTLIAASRVRHPGITLHVVEGMTGHLEKWLLQDDIDIAVLFDPPSSHRPVPRPFGVEQLVLIGPIEGPLANCKEVSMAEVCTLPLIHTTRAHQLRQMLDAHSMAQKRPLKFVAEIDSLAQIKSLVHQTRGYTILPRTSVGPDWVSGRVHFWPISDPDIHLTLYMVPSPKFQRLPHCAAVVETLEEETRKVIVNGGWTGASIEVL